MANLSKNKTLPSQVLANLFLQLAQMETAGIPLMNAIALIEKTDSKLSNQLIKMQRFLNSGSSIADAAYKAGVFNSTHRAMISTAEKSGTLAAVYKQLAKYYQDKYSRLKKIQSKLYLPALMLLLALLIKPVPLLITSEITFLSYLGLSLGRYLLIISFLFILFKLPLWFKPVFYSLQMRLPLVKNWVIKRQINAFFLYLAIMLDAGLTFEEALPLAVATIENAVLKKRFDIAIRSRHKGDSVKTILSKVNEISPTTLQIIHTGEESGRLAESIMHFANLEAETLYLQDDSLAEWLPRLFYLVVVLWMSASLLGF